MVKHLRICLLFDKIYLQKCEEHFGGEQIGSNDTGELYKGTIHFMIVGLKESTHVIKSSPQITINAAWFRDELLECIDAQTELQ